MQLSKDYLKRITLDMLRTVVPPHPRFRFSRFQLPVVSQLLSENIKLKIPEVNSLSVLNCSLFRVA